MKLDSGETKTFASTDSSIVTYLDYQDIPDRFAGVASWRRLQLVLSCIESFV